MGSERSGAGSWMEPPFILPMNAFAENSGVILMREVAQMVKWAASPFPQLITADSS